MAFKSYISEPLRKKYSTTHQRDLYQDIVTTSNKIKLIFKKEKKKSTLNTSWCSHTQGIRRDIGSLRTEIRGIDTLSWSSSDSRGTKTPMEGGNMDPQSTPSKEGTPPPNACEQQPSYPTHHVDLRQGEPPQQVEYVIQKPENVLHHHQDTMQPPAADENTQDNSSTLPSDFTTSTVTGITTSISFKGHQDIQYISDKQDIVRKVLCFNEKQNSTHPGVWEGPDKNLDLSDNDAEAQQNDQYESTKRGSNIGATAFDNYITQQLSPVERKDIENKESENNNDAGNNDEVPCKENQERNKSIKKEENKSRTEDGQKINTMDAKKEEDIRKNESCRSKFNKDIQPQVEQNWEDMREWPGEELTDGIINYYDKNMKPKQYQDGVN